MLFKIPYPFNAIANQSLSNVEMKNIIFLVTKGEEKKR